MQIQTIPCASDNYAYLIIADNGQTVVVDPSDAVAVRDRIESEGVSLQAIWLTHHHLDHIAGAEPLCNRYGSLEVFASVNNLKQQRIATQTRGVEEGYGLNFAGHTVELIETPGHTLGDICYLIDGCLFCGDTLFLSGCGRVFEGTMEMMQASLRKLRDLDPNTKIYCGHEYTLGNLGFAHTVEPNNPQIRERIDWAQKRCDLDEPTVPGTISDELLSNPFLRWDVDEVIDAAHRFGESLSDPVSVFAAIRRAKDRF